ncbi:MAG: GIY-YIG nuclease family protein [Deltaproteobacteria bacterium]|nr:GIY-YIG nuclease family protein [Deltaproteobacteria bacterium]MBI3294019.1 GIY-YIG nuclease family protein [Deltaproteobacteria bacterium]
MEGIHRDRLRTFIDKYERQGLYALYDEKGNLYYVGRATDIVSRLDTHKDSDKHSGKWSSMAFYVLDSKSDIHELESLIIAIASPPGNVNQGKIKGSLREDFGKYWLAQAKEEPEAVLKPDYSNVSKKTSLKDKRLTDKKLSAWVNEVGVKEAARILEISAPYVSILRQDLERFREWITGSGKKESVILSMNKKSP